jgi:hypothetical protein
MITRRRFAVIAATSTFAPALVGRAAFAQPWPRRFVRFVVPFRADAAPDVGCRVLTARLSEMWGQQAVVDTACEVRRVAVTRNPLRCRVCCDVDPDEVSAFETDDDEGIEQVETDSRDNEQVHSGNIRRVITQEGPPPLAWRSLPFDHVLADA